MKKGLTESEVIELRKEYGKNILVKEKKECFILKILKIMIEPMFLLLLISAIIYFILGEPRDGIIMLVFVIGIISIDVIQEWKTDKTLKALADLSTPRISVIRDGIKKEISSEDLVPKDIMLIHEGIKIPADGKVIKCSGCLVDESSLTGESIGVWKYTKRKNNNDYWRDDYCYAGTLVLQGSATIEVEKTGINTEYGKIGSNINSIKEEKSNLQKQVDYLVKVCAIIALLLFIMVTAFTYLNILEYPFKDRIIKSILSGITLAMAMIPEEFPVVLTVFLSIGAFKLAKKNSLVKKMSSIETLGAISVLCVDKTGTITQNNMTVDSIYNYSTDEEDLCEVMGLCCLEDTYDPMEKAMLNYCKKLDITHSHLYGGKVLKDYPFSNKNKVMGIAWDHYGEYICACKGSPESIIKLCKLSKEEEKNIKREISKMSKKGLRVIGIAKENLIDESSVKEKLGDYNLEFCGLVGLIDPPKKGIKKDIELCNKAGIRVIMITGDNGITAKSIAKSVGIKNSNNIITGEEIDNMSDEELKDRVKNTSIFSRVIPEHKLKIVKALKENGEIVAMTGDGVNDAPALKCADIGISMGLRGSEVSKEASDLVLMDDNFSTIISTIEDGRRIYDNIKKAIGYILVIHIPIALSSLVGPLLSINPSNLLLLPIHVVLLELIIDPTCSIVLERQPKEKNIMNRKPRNSNSKILSIKRLIKSIIQGLVLFISSFLTYYIYLSITSVNTARTMGLVIIMLGNLFLVQVNSSDIDYAYTTIKKLVNDKVMWLINILTILGIFIIVYTPVNKILKLTSLSLKEMIIVIFISFISVFWFEIVKLIKKVKDSRK